MPRLDDYLSGRLAVHQRPDGLAALRQRIAGADQRLDPAVEQHSVKLGHVLLVQLGRARNEIAPENADDASALDQWQVERQAGNVAASETNNQITSSPADGAKRRFGQLVPNGVENYVDAGFSGEILNRGLEIDFRIVDRLVGTVAAGDGQLLFTRS